MKKVAVFVDVDNLFHRVRRKFPGKKVNYKLLLEKATEDRESVVSVAYGFQVENEAASFIACLERFGYRPEYETFTKGEKKSCYPNMTRDVNDTDADLFVIGSADPSILAIVRAIKAKGKEVQLIGCGLSNILKNESTSHVEIDDTYLI